MPGSEFLPVVAIWGFIVLVIVVVLVISAQMRKARKADMAEFAARHGFKLMPDEPSGCLTGGLFGGKPSFGSELIASFEGFQPFGIGHSQKADMIVVGRSGRLDYTFFDYRYTTGSGKNSTTHLYGIAAVRVPMCVPYLSIRPEGFFDRIGAALGFGDVQFESEEFNRRFHVKAGDSKFAYDVIHPEAMAYLMATEERHWQLLGEFLLLNQSGSYAPSELERAMGDMERFIELIPDYVRQDRGTEKE